MELCNQETQKLVNSEDNNLTKEDILKEITEDMKRVIVKEAINSFVNNKYLSSGTDHDIEYSNAQFKANLTIIHSKLQHL